MNFRQLNFYEELLLNHGEEVASRYKAFVESPDYWESAPALSSVLYPHSLKNRRQPDRRIQFLTIPVLKERILRIMERKGWVTIPLAKVNISDLSYMSNEEAEALFKEIAAEKGLQITKNRFGSLELTAA